MILYYLNFTWYLQIHNLFWGKVWHFVDYGLPGSSVNMPREYHTLIVSSNFKAEFSVIIGDGLT